MSYPEDPARRAAILDLLGATWAHVPDAVERARSWGADWCDVSTPFARFRGPRAVSVVGVLEMPLRLAGADVVVAGVHGVGTHPAHRGRGLMRDAMEQALAVIDGRHELAVLWTEEPSIYERFGFRVVREHRFELDARTAGRGGLTPIDPDEPSDLALLRDLLARRAPTSDRLGTRDPGWHFLIDLALLGDDAPRLARLEGNDVIVAWSEGDEGIRIDDVIAPEPFPLARVIEALGPRGARVTVTFSHERIAGGIGARAVPSPTSDVLLVRGEWPIEEPFALPPLVRC